VRNITGHEGTIFAIRIKNNTLSKEVWYGDLAIIDTSLTPDLSDEVLLDLPYIGLVVMSYKNIEHLEMVTGCKFGFIGVVTEIRRPAESYRNHPDMNP